MTHQKKIGNWCIGLAVILASLIAAMPVRAGVVYHDGFSDARTLTGSLPDQTVNSNAWSVVGSSLATSGGNVPSVSQNQYGGNNYALLPVNGASGVTLDGSQSFVLSATVRNLTNTYTGIIIKTASSSYTLIVGAGGTGAVTFSIPGDANYDHLYNMPNIVQPVRLALSYDANTGLMTALFNGQPMSYSYTHGPGDLHGAAAVNASALQGVTGVGILYHQYAWVTNGYNATAGTGATIDDLTFTIVPEPASAALWAAAGFGLLTSRRRRV